MIPNLTLRLIYLALIGASIAGLIGGILLVQNGSTLDIVAGVLFVLLSAFALLILFVVWDLSKL